jgi:GNAT superfamily N-acetyltransferase
MPNRYQTREADLQADTAKVCGLWAANLQGMSPQAAAHKWRHGYCDSPHGAGAALLLQAQGEPEPVGVIGLHPRRGFLGTTEIAMANLADFAVAPAHRTLGPAVTLVRQALALAARRFSVLYGLPNRHSHAALTRAGLQSIGAVVRYAKPLRFRGRGGAWTHPALGGLPAPLADLVLVLADGYRRLVRPRGLALAPAAFDSAALETLWAQRPRQVLLGERNGAALRWRFEPQQSAAWQLLLAAGRQGQPLGYVVWRKVQQNAEVGDFFCIQPETQTTPLLLALAQHLRRQRLHNLSLSFFGLPCVVKALGQAGFVARSAHRQVFTTTPALALAAAPAAWYLTPFDEDAD